MAARRPVAPGFVEVGRQRDAVAVVEGDFRVQDLVALREGLVPFGSQLQSLHIGMFYVFLSLTGHARGRCRCGQEQHEHAGCRSHSGVLRFSVSSGSRVFPSEPDTKVGRFSAPDMIRITDRSTIFTFCPHRARRSCSCCINTHPPGGTGVVRVHNCVEYIRIRSASRHFGTTPHVAYNPKVTLFLPFWPAN